MEQKTEIITHRVGTVTLGITLVLFGMVYLLRMLIPSIPLRPILDLWPAVMIILGAEVLLAAAGKKEFIMDKASIFLLFLEVFFLFGMAGAEIVLEYIERAAA